MNYIEIGKIPPNSKNELSTPEQLVENLKSLIGEKFPLTGKPRTDGSNFRKMITNHLLSNYIPKEAVEYEIVPPKQKGVPSFLREYIDTYIVTSGVNYNLQVWNRNPNSSSVQVDLKNGETLLASDVRFVLGKINADEIIESIVIMTPEYIENRFGKFGKPTVKQQLIISNKKREEILKKHKLDDEPHFYGTNYSPVVNEVIEIPVIDDNDRSSKAKSILKELEGNTLVYFPTVTELNKYIDEIEDEGDKKANTNPILREFVTWAKSEIHEKWSVLKAMENGYLVHHGQLPLGIRMLELDLFNDTNERFYYRMLCTATLLEGVNTTAKNIIITKPARGSGNAFDAFDFYNLVGRTGRLFQHYLGKAYYIKGPGDRNYAKGEALKSIEFELTTESIDIDINSGDYAKHQNFIDFLNTLHIDYDTYKEEIGSKCRFLTVLKLYSKYCRNKQSLLAELDKQDKNDFISKLGMIRELYKIVNEKQYKMKLQTFLINKLTYKTVHRLNIRTVVNDTMQWYEQEDINYVIKSAISLKNSYIEFDFYKRIQVILFFMKCERVEQRLIDVVNEKLMRNIELLYYINSPSRKMLKDMGIYEGDIETIIGVIGDDFETVETMHLRTMK